DGSDAGYDKSNPNCLIPRGSQPRGHPPIVSLNSLRRLHHSILVAFSHRRLPLASSCQAELVAGVRRAPTRKSDPVANTTSSGELARQAASRARAGSGSTTIRGG